VSARIHRFPAPPPVESRAIWCRTCRSLVRSGDSPMVEALACYRCTSPNRVTWREALLLLAVGLFTVLCLAAAIQIAEREDAHDEMPVEGGLR